MKKDSVFTLVKVIGLTAITFGIYGVCWAMNNAFEEEDINADETEKDADFTKRAATSALLSRHDLH